MRGAGVATASSTPPRRRSSATTTQQQTTPAAATATSKPKLSKNVTLCTPPKQPIRASPASSTKRPNLTSPSKPLTKPAASPSRLPIRRSPQRSPTSTKPQPNTKAVKSPIQPTTAPQTAASDVQIWSFDDQLNNDDQQQRDEKEQAVRTIPLSTLFSDWPSTSSTVLSFQSLSAYTLPTLPSYELIPALCDRLLVRDGVGEGELYGAVSGLREYGASDLLSSPYVSLVVSALVSTVLLLTAPLLTVSGASLLLLADLFDAAHSSPTAAELYLALVQHVVDRWQSTVHWPDAHSDVWLEDRPTSSTHRANPLSHDKGSVHSHNRCGSHAHLIRLARFIAIIQRQLPSQWVYFSHSTHQSLIAATLQLYASAISPTSATLLSPAQLLAQVDPTSSWLPLWLYQLPTRKLFVQLLTSSKHAPLLDWMVAPLSATTIADSLSLSVLSETVPVCVPTDAVVLLSALQRASFVQCLLHHSSGRLLLKATWERAALPSRSLDDVRNDIQRLQLAAQHSLMKAKHSDQ